MANGLLNGGLVMIDGYPIDITLSEDHTFDADVTDFPVESGADITDNIRPKPIVVSFEGVVSDTPLEPLATTRAVSDDLPQVEAYLRLQKIRNARLPVQITTSLDVFDNMALKTLTIPRAAGTSNSLHFKVTFVQITQVQVTRVSVPIATPSHQVTGAPSNGPFAKIPVDLDDHSWWDDDNDTWWQDARNVGVNSGVTLAPSATPIPQKTWILTHRVIAATQFPRPDITTGTSFNVVNDGTPVGPPGNESLGQGSQATTGLIATTVTKRPANIIYIDVDDAQIF